MLLALLGNIRTRWASLLLRLAEYFARTRCILSGLSNLCKAGPIDFLGPVDTLAPIDILESRDKQRDDFIEMIKKRERDIISLASYHNEGKSCKQFQEPEAGSFNICFFIQYIPDGEKRVLRFPLLPVLHNPHDMLLSEVTTMEHLRENTTIPIAQVFASGLGGKHDPGNDTGLPFTLLKYMPGQSLTELRLRTASEEQLERFFTQLANILAQLRAQEFDQAGSLTKDSSGQIKPSSLHSVDLNDLQLCGMQQDVPQQPTALAFVECRYKLLRLRRSLLYDDMTEINAQHEVFALEDFQARLFHLNDPSLNFGPFVLMHGDLRPPNIIVDDDLSITAIIDWQWSSTVPVSFFTPPLWLAGTHINQEDERYNIAYARLYQALVTEGSNACSVLSEDWGPDLCSSPRLFVPPALFRHDWFFLLYYKALFPGYYNNIDRREKLRSFFKTSSFFSREVREKIAAPRRFT